MKIRLFDNKTGKFVGGLESAALPQPGNYVSIVPSSASPSELSLAANYKVTAVRFQANGVIDLAVSPVGNLPPTLTED